MNQNMVCVLDKRYSPALSKCNFLNNSLKKKKNTQDTICSTTEKT